MSNFVSQSKLDAAKALLELRFFRSGNNEAKSDKQNVEYAQQPLISRSAPVTDFSTNTSTPTPKPFLAKWRIESEKIVDNNIQIPKKHEIDTQTESIPDLLKQREELIKELTEENLALKKQIKALQEERSSTDTLSERASESSKNDSPEALQRSNKRHRSHNSTSQSSSHTDATISNAKKFKNFQKESPNPKNLSSGMVPIGNGYALIPARLLKCMDWSCHSNATRKLLTAVFPREVLATHSLTGKRSPAFPNKPPKKKLDKSLVNDIVTTVSERCGVPENLVRTSITTKCADESKMLRTRLQPKPKIKKMKKENIPPSDASDTSED